MERCLHITQILIFRKFLGREKDGKYLRRKFLNPLQKNDFKIVKFKTSNLV